MVGAQRRRTGAHPARAGAVALALVLSLAVVPAVADAAPARLAAPVRPATAPTPPALPVRPVNDAWARQLMAAVDPGTGEPPAGAVARLGTAIDGGAVGSALVTEMSWIDGWLDARIDELYEDILGRPSDVNGHWYWRGRAQLALSDRETSDIEKISLNLASSNEAWRRGGSEPAGYVDRTFQVLLGRSVDPAGRAYWSARVGTPAARQAFVRSLLRSRERATRLVGDSYVQYLGRAADPGGRASWVAKYSAAQVGEWRLALTLLTSSESRGSGCDPLDPRLCLLPFPNDRFTVPDATTATGRRVSFKREWLPANKDGVRPNPQELNRNDGFSVGSAALLKVPGIDLEQTGAPTLDDLGSSLAPDAPIVVIDADTGERHPIFAELDANIPVDQQAADQLLYLRPAVNYEAGHRYIVALRDLKDASGATIAAPAAFTFYRDPAGVGVGAAEDRRPHMEQLFSELDAAGIGRDDLYLAWDFTVASTENTTGRMLSIRDRALQSLGGDAPAFAVTSTTANPTAGVGMRVEGTFEVPLFLTGDGGPGNAFKTGADGLPVRNGTYTAGFDCELPTLADGDTARAVVYGHGLFGDRGEVRSAGQRAMVANHDMAYCATDWIGMSEQDIGNAATILQEVSTFPTLADRSQQGILNTIFLGRLMVSADGFVSDPAFQINGGDPVLDTSALFYDGNSQGGIIGGAYVAASPDVSAGVLGVTGMNYSTLLERSVDFDPFFDLMKVTYPKPAERVLGLQIIQMLWDRAETNGYAAHLTEDPLPGSGANRVLLHTALGDHQVATFTAEIEARTAGMDVHRPMYGPGRTYDVDPGWGLDSIDYPSTGSALVIWDTGSPLAPLANVPPRAGADPHEDPRRSVDAQEQKDQFLRTGGTIVDVCSGAPCTAPAT